MTEQRYPDLEQTVGRMMRDPEVKENSRGKYASLRLSIKRSYGTGQGDYGKEEIVTVFVGGKSFDAANLLRKGQMVAIEGSRKEGEYQGKPQTSWIATRVWRCVEPTEGEDW